MTEQRTDPAGGEPDRPGESPDASRPPEGAATSPGSTSRPADAAGTAGSAGPDSGAGADVPGDTAPTPPSGTEIQPAVAATPDAAGPVDEEQLRQFRQFQQFQEFLKFQEAQQGGQGGAVVPGTPPAQHPPAPYQGSQVPAAPSGHAAPLPEAAPGRLPEPAQRPRRRPPRWLTWLGKKLLGWLVAFLLLALAATWAYNHFFGTGDSDQTTEEYARGGGGSYHATELLADNPYAAVRSVYDAIAQADPDTGMPDADKACGRFEEATQQRFADNIGSADCREAVNGLHEQVTHVNDYAESIYPRGYLPTSKTERIDSCSFTISGGPALGVFTVEKVEHDQWLITGHDDGPETCPGQGPSRQQPSGPAQQPGN
ncbi:hypothetical protein LY13_001756 [Prauserella aidingensis]|uniref:hypothetical protein n=1 Tax=Prauserella aidingensis TaxID=387890 RepID=UPI0027E2DA6A|nr:hypothetical protein [Prauserella aidingensis]MCP2253012.1 hypothetical protein [Prauserella aidingensis]